MWNKASKKLYSTLSRQRGNLSLRKTWECKGYAPRRIHQAAWMPCVYTRAGTGKSHLASSAAILNNGIYTTWELLDLRLRSTYNSYAARKTEYQMMMYFCTIPFLVIDEIDKGKNEDAKMRCLSLICRERHERKRPLWLAGNCNYEWVKTMLDSSVMDRLKQKGKSFNFFWESYRPKLREANEATAEAIWY